MTAASLRNRNRRSIRRQNHFRTANLIEVAKDFRLDFKFLRGRFNHEIAAREIAALEHGFDPFQSGGLVSRGDFAFGQLAVEVLADGFEAAIQKSLLHIAQRHAISAARKHVGDAVAHGSRADHSHPLDWHKISLLLRLRGP